MNNEGIAPMQEDKKLSEASLEQQTPHEPQSIEPPEAILDVAQIAHIEEPSIEALPALDEKAARVVQHINTLAEKDKEREFAEADLYGSRPGDARSWRGLAQAGKDLEARKEKIDAVDTRILNTEELALYRQEKSRVEQNLAKNIPKEEFAKAFINDSSKEIENHIEVSLNDLQTLPEELQTAIRTGDQSIFKKYGVDSWGARQIGRTLSLRERENESSQRMHEQHIAGIQQRRKDGTTTWQDIASVIDTPDFAIFSGDEMRKVLTEQGITEDGINVLRARYQEEQKKQEYKPETFVSHEVQSLPEIITDGLLVGIEKERVAKEAEENATTATLPVMPEENTAEGGLPSEEFVHETPDVDDEVTPEMLEALKNAGINVPPGKQLTAFEAQKLMRKVLGARGTEQIEAVEKRASGIAADEASPSSVVFAPETKPELSGLYDVRNGGHIYNTNDTSPDALALDNEESEKVVLSSVAGNGVLSTVPQKSPVPLFSAENGVVTYDRELDPDLAQDKATLNALMKGRNKTQPTLPTEITTQVQDPNLSGQYHVENGVAHTGFVAGEGHSVFSDDPSNVMTKLEVLAHTTAETEDDGGPLIERNLDGKPEFVPQDALELDAQGEAMERLINNTPEVVNLGKTELTPDAPYPKIEEEKVDSEYKPAEEKDSVQVLTPEQSRLEQIEVYRKEWNSFSDEQKNIIQEGVRKAFTNESAHPVKVMRKSGAVEDWEFSSLLPIGEEVTVYTAAHNKNVPILEFVSMNLPALYAEATNLLPNEKKDEDSVEKIEEGAQNVFDSEAELAAILKAPTSERKALLATYKEKLAEQKMGLAKVQAEMVEDIRKNPDMTKDEFEKLFSERAGKYHATEDQRAIGTAIFEKFQEKHQAVEKVRAEHLDDAELFKAAFGQSPKGRVEVIKGPMSLYFRCHDLEDYALIYSGKCLITGASITPEDTKTALMSGGVSNVGSLIPELSGAVIAENAGGRPFEGYALTTYEHEEQHAINGIMQRGVQEKMNYDSNLDNLLLASGDLNDTHEKLKNAEAPELPALENEMLQLKSKIKLYDGRRSRAIRNRDIDRRAQDEILAFTRDGRDLGGIYVILTKKKSDGGLYDYASDILHSPSENFFPKEYSEIIPELSADFEAQKQEIFGAEYESVLKSGLDAYQKLRDAGYKEEAIRGIFHDEPLARWEKVVNRLVKEEKQVPEAVVEKYQAQFNIPKETLRSIEGFRELSEGQQLLVLERMKSVAFDDINVEKVSRYRTRIDELSKSDSWWDKVKGVGMKATKQFQLGRMKDEVSREWLKGTDVDAAAMKKDALEGLVAQALTAKEFGVTEHEGKLSTVFVSSEDFGEDIDDATETQINDFNELANQYSNKSFAENDKVGKAQLKAQYESKAREIAHLLAEQTEGKWSGDNAAMWRNKLESAVQMSRFFQDNPEVDKELETAGKNIGSAIGFKNLLAERGTYSLVSGGARFLGVSAMGLAAIPAVAFLGGGVMGWRRAKQELSENDLLAAMGERDTSDDALHEKNPGSNVNDRAKNVVNSEVLVTKLGKLLSEYRSADETNKKILEKRLESRVAYTTRKMEEHLIELGSVRGDRAERISQLALTLSEAQSELGFVDKGIDIFGTRLDNILDIREEKIEANRKKHLIKQAAKGATMGAVFSGAGMLIGGMIPGHAAAGGLGTEASNDLSEQDVSAVASAIRAEASVGNLPIEITGPQQEMLAKGFTEYMVADAAEKKLIAETLGMTTEQMDAKIMNILSLSPGEQFVLAGPTVEGVVNSDEVATLVYNVKPGENLSAIMRGHLDIFKDLTPAQQENVIQNFIQKLTPEEMKAIGITDVNQLHADQPIQLDKLNEILATKRIGGEDLFEHAKQVFARTPEGDIAVVASGINESLSSPLSPEDTTAIERAFGRSISGSESSVLHSIKGLSSLAENDSERQALGEALDHLQREMSGAGRPLTTAEMVRILHEHNGLDSKMKFLEETPVARAPEASAVSHGISTETASSTPLPEGISKEHIAHWQELPPGVKLDEATILGKTYLESDMGNLFEKDMFGNIAKEWTFVREQSAQTVFGAQEGEVFSSDASIRKIQEYAKAEGFTKDNGYIPHERETVGEFLRRVHTLRVLVGGPRPEQH